MFLKKTLISLIAVASFSYAADFQLDQICDGTGNLTDTEVEIAKKFPVGDCNALSKSRGGNIDAVDAVKDGMGVVTLAPIGQPKKTNIQTQTNKIAELVKKHGVEAKEANKPLLEYIQDEKGMVLTQEDFGKKVVTEPIPAGIFISKIVVKNMSLPKPYKYMNFGLVGETESIKVSTVDGACKDNGRGTAYFTNGSGITNPCYQSSTITLNYSPAVNTSDVVSYFLVASPWVSNNGINAFDVDFYNTNGEVFYTENFRNLLSGNSYQNSIIYSEKGKGLYGNEAYLNNPAFTPNFP